MLGTFGIAKDYLELVFVIKTSHKKHIINRFCDTHFLEYFLMAWRVLMISCIDFAFLFDI
jgi:hypothetical protein